MTSLFNFQTLKVDLIRETSSLNIEILENSSIENPIQRLSKIAEELMKMINWSSKYIEISSIYFHGLENFSLSNLPEIKTTHQSIVELFHGVQEVVYGMLYLPQTIITDYKTGARDLGIELGLGADIKIAQSHSILDFNHLEIGLTPGCGLLGPLSRLVNIQSIKDWIFLSQKIKGSELLKSSFLSLCYNFDQNIDNSFVKELQLKIKNQSNIARIQAKRAILEELLEEIDSIKRKERSYLKSSLAAGDLYNYLKEKKSKNSNFIKAKDFSKMIKSETRP